MKAACEQGNRRNPRRVKKRPLRNCDTLQCHVDRSESKVVAQQCISGINGWKKKGGTNHLTKCKLVTPADLGIFMAYAVRPRRSKSCLGKMEIRLLCLFIIAPYFRLQMAGRAPAGLACRRLRWVCLPRATTAIYPHSLSYSTTVGRILSVPKFSDVALDKSCDSFRFSRLNASHFTIMRKRLPAASICPTMLLHASQKRMCLYG